jgi:hypothetical protein
MDKTYSSQAITSIYTFTSGMALETKLEATPNPLGETNTATESFCFQTQTTDQPQENEARFRIQTTLFSHPTNKKGLVKPAPSFRITCEYSTCR